MKNETNDIIKVYRGIVVKKYVEPPKENFVLRFMDKVAQYIDPTLAILLSVSLFVAIIAWLS